MALFIEFLLREWILVAALLTAAGMLVFHESRKAGPAMTPQQAIKLVNNEDGIFLDVRDGSDYKQGHISDALHIPFAKLKAREDELKDYRERPIVIVCKMGQQSAAAAKQLRASGFDKVHKMAGGMLEWRNLQLPVVR
ncbi:MAG: rhodanese-like domain-containing protein [Chromatocurvus sp.]